MREWLINKLPHDRVRSKIPTWFLRYLVWRNWRLVRSGHPRYASVSWTDLELAIRRHQIGFVYKYKGRFVVFGPEKPVGVPFTEEE